MSDNFGLLGINERAKSEIQKGVIIFIMPRHYLT